MERCFRRKDVHRSTIKVSAAVPHHSVPLALGGSCEKVLAPAIRMESVDSVISAYGRTWKVA